MFRDREDGAKIVSREQESIQSSPADLKLSQIDCVNLKKNLISSPVEKLTITNYKLHKAVLPRKPSVHEIKLCIRRYSNTDRY